MSTQAQILSNHANAQKSSGPASAFFLLHDIEDEFQFEELKAALIAEYNPQTETERILVRRLWESEWLRRRAITFRRMCFRPNDYYLYEEKRFALFLRYQTTHERAFYKALNELQKLRNEKRKKNKPVAPPKEAANGTATREMAA
jgi:hypothetical protein